MADSLKLIKELTVDSDAKDADAEGRDGHQECYHLLPSFLYEHRLGLDRRNAGKQGQIDCRTELIGIPERGSHHIQENAQTQSRA